MNISEKTKERFCKDCNILIKIFKEPYFNDRLKLFDPFYDTLTKWDLFITELQKYKTEQEYYEDYNRVKDAAIQSIKDTKSYQEFNSMDMNEYGIVHKSLPGTSIFKPQNNKRSFISIDMKKANFSSLHQYNADIFHNKNTWEDFIKQFTNNEHIINSKYIRQVILGNCNPKRHTTYEKYIMDQLLIQIEKNIDMQCPVVFFSNDEIVFDVTDLNMEERIELRNTLENFTKERFSVPFRVENFNLYKIINTDGYYKKIFDDNLNTRIELKGLSSYIIPFVLRKFLNEPVTENDKVFIYEGCLSKYIDVPQIEFERDEEQNYEIEEFDDFL